MKGPRNFTRWLLPAVLAWLAGCGAAPQQDPGTPTDGTAHSPAGQRRFIVNDDGEAEPIAKGRTVEAYLAQRFQDAVGSQVDAYFICVGSTDRGPATGKKPRLQDTQNRWYPAMKAPPEIDRMTRAYLEAAKEAGMEIFASIRMNDIHDAWAPRLTYPLKMARPDLLLGNTRDHAPDAVMRAFWSGFDYAKEEVRRHFLDFIRTYCRQYDYDGLELDYFRHPLFFKPGEARQNLDTMTSFVRKVRGILREIGQERGRPYLLAIRVPDTPAMALRTGLDVEQWMKEGLLDMLIVGGGYMPYAGRLESFIDLAHRYGLPAYPCINHFREPLAMRSLASNFWALGADGIYLFNYFGVRLGMEGGRLRPEVSDSAERLKVLSQIGDPASITGLEKRFVADNGASIFYCGFTNPQGQFPVRLVEARPIKLVVGDDVGGADRPPSELLLNINVEDVPAGEGIAVEVNGAAVPLASLERTGETSFTARLQQEPLKRGLNTIAVLPGPNSTGRLSSRVTGLELQVSY
jgi:hypothetical protein